MAHVKLKGIETQLNGSFLNPGDLAPDFALVNQDLETVTLESFKERQKVLATVPSLDTPVCREENRKNKYVCNSTPFYYCISYLQGSPLQTEANLFR